VLPIGPFFVIYHRTTLLHLFLVLDLLQIFSVLNVYMSPTECFPLSVIMALAHEKLEANRLHLTNKDRLRLQKLLIGLREETQRVASNKYTSDCLRIRGLHTVKDSVQSFLVHFQQRCKQ